MSTEGNSIVTVKLTEEQKETDRERRSRLVSENALKKPYFQFMQVSPALLKSACSPATRVECELCSGVLRMSSMMTEQHSVIGSPWSLSTLARVEGAIPEHCLLFLNLLVCISTIYMHRGCTSLNRATVG